MAWTKTLEALLEEPLTSNGRFVADGREETTEGEPKDLMMWKNGKDWWKARRQKPWIYFPQHALEGKIAERVISLQ